MGGVMEQITQRLRLPEELLDGARVTMTAGRLLRIENHQCLLSYTSDAVEVGCGKQRLRIRGEALRICALTQDELQIEGKILGVEVFGA